MSTVIDYSTYPADGTYRPMKYEDILIETVARKISTDQGDLFWAPFATYNILRYRGRNMGDAELTELSYKLTSLFDNDPLMRVEFVVSLRGLDLYIEATIFPNNTPEFVVSFLATQSGLIVRDLDGSEF